jgi:hypothetical protein
MRRIAALAAAWCTFAAASAAAGPYTEAGYDSSLMVAWATEVEAIVRGPVHIANPGLGLASFGSPELALGPANDDPDDPYDVVSLGDGGSLTLYFETGIGDGPGDDFAVYENGFFVPSAGGLHAELAFVEVSSDGASFARFPATSLNGVPVASFDTLDPSDYHNLAGKHELTLGTGFDLDDLAGDPLVSSGALLLHDVRYVRLIDVVGDGSRLDRLANPIYDPYSTPFPAGGFDAEAVGVLHEAPEPGAIGMLAAGSGLLAVLSRRRAHARRCARGG